MSTRNDGCVGGQGGPLFHIVVAILMYAWSAFASAQGFPAKPIRLIVPYPAGGGSDLIARPLAQKLTENLGQQVIVENRGGAGGNIGMEFVAKSAPDGYNLVLGLTAQFAVNPALYPKLPYDPVKDFAPVTQLVRNPYILLVHPTLPVKSVKELIALAKARKGQLTYSSSGSGSGGHLCGATLGTLGGVDILHVPYKGAAPALTDLLAGHVQISFIAWRTASPHVKVGKVRALAVTTEKRSPVLPDMPAVAETLPGYDVPVWYGIAAPAGTPKDVVAKLHSEIVRVLNTPDFRQRMEAEAAEVIADTPEQFADYIRSEIVKWAKLVKASGAKLD